jgi:diguanylate cyclase (GGDEF)-like protein
MPLALCRRATRCGPVADDTPDPRQQRLWELCYLDPLAALALARQVALDSGPAAAWGWWHAALADVRVGDAAAADEALLQARQAFAQRTERDERAQGEALCDEVQAIVLRRRSDFAASARLQAEIDQRQGFVRDAMYRFVAHNSRAITCKLLSQHDDCLRHAYAAVVAAQDLKYPGPSIVAVANLGGYHQNLFNLDDAKSLSQEALALARQHRVQQAIGVAAVNLVAIHHAAGDGPAARAMVEFLVTHVDEVGQHMLDQFPLYLAMGHLSVGEIDQAMAYLQRGAQTLMGDGDGLAQWAWLMARCLLARGDAASALEVLQDTQLLRQETRVADLPYDQLELHRARADAHEQLGDTAAALACLRQAHALFEELVGRSARARFIALEVTHQLEQAQRERDSAVTLQRQAESDRLRLAELNAALQAKIDETQRLHAQLSEQALRDPLTGLHNRRYLFEVVPGLLELARRQSSPLCVVLLDLDHFKLLNDTFGHAAGDEVLTRFASLLLSTLRRSDIVSRHGGEEFVAVLPDMDAEDTKARIEQLLSAFQVAAPQPGTKRVPRTSFSAGIALFPQHGSTLEHLLLRADKALYAAKHLGRARVEVAPHSGFGALV